MTIKKLICTFIILCISSSAFASLIRVDFSAEFGTTATPSTIVGWFQYDDVSDMLTDISLEILGKVFTVGEVGYLHDTYGPGNFLLYASDNGVKVSAPIIGDFFLANYPSAPDFAFADGTQVNNTRNVSITSSRTEVPAPSTIGIFALGLIGLAARRFKKQS